MENPLISGKPCPNCGHETEVSDKFCSNCGQSTKPIRVSLGEFVNESLSGLLSMDSKVIHSILPLLTKPGFLSREFLKGRRMQYLPPVRMYLTISILYFFILAASNKIEKLSGLMNAPTEIGAEINDDNDSSFVININQPDTLATDSTKTISDGDSVDKAFGDLLDTIDEDEDPNDPWNKYLKEETEKIAKDPDAFVNYFRDKISLIIFLSLPVFALILKLLYFRQKLTYIEHLVFIFHTQTVLFLLLLFAHFLSFASDDVIWLSLLLYWIYALMAIKNFYKQGWLKTIFKYFVLNISFGFVTLFFMLSALIILFLSY